MKKTFKVEDVAVLNLISAIWMYAYDYDEPAVHLVAHSSFELITERLSWGNFDEVLKEHIREDKINEFKKIINKPNNFFKHGSHGYKPMQEFEFDTLQTEYLLIQACTYIQAAPKQYQNIPATKSFIAYYSICNPELFTKDGHGLKQQELIEKHNIKIDKDNPKKLLQNFLDYTYKPLKGI